MFMFQVTRFFTVSKDFFIFPSNGKVFKADTEEREQERLPPTAPSVLLWDVIAATQLEKTKTHLDKSFYDMKKC